MNNVLAFAGVVLDQYSGLPIAGAEVQITYDGSVTFTNANGTFYLGTTLPDNWYEDYLQISAFGHVTVGNYYYGYGFISRLQIYLSP